MQLTHAPGRGVYTIGDPNDWDGDVAIEVWDDTGPEIDSHRLKCAIVLTKDEAERLVKDIQSALDTPDHGLIPGSDAWLMLNEHLT